MSLTSTYFVIFAIFLVPIYYLINSKFQWYVLLVSSIIFYVFSGWTNIFFVLFVATSAYCATFFLQKLKEKQNVFIKENKDTLSKDEKKTYKQKIKNKRKAIMLACIILNICILIFFKVFSRLKLSIEALDSWNIIVPLGLSYFTLQTIGYVIDVYRNNAEAEKNPLKLLLFVSFFPQVTQGPISDYAQLTGELFKEHIFSYKNFSWGFQRLIWGYFKKLIIANIMSSYTSAIFENYKTYSGITLFIGMFVVMVQLYADFSGYMDIVCGLCEMLDIRLTENFNKPFFSKSLSEFWRRWHISLGDWLRKYFFYPISISNFFLKMGKKLRNHGLMHIGKILPTALASVITFFVIGIWHGLEWRYAAYGLMNGLIIMVSSLMKPIFTETKTKLHIKDESKIFNLFRMARTFTIISALEVLSDVGTLRGGIDYFVVMICNLFRFPSSFNELMPFLEIDFNGAVCIVGILMILVFSMIERRTYVRNYFNRMPSVARAVILSCLFCFIISVGMTALIENDGGFMYANF